MFFLETMFQDLLILWGSIMWKTLLSHNSHSGIRVKLVCFRSFCLLECLVMSYELLILADVQKALSFFNPL